MGRSGRDGLDRQTYDRAVSRTGTDSTDNMNSLYNLYDLDGDGTYVLSLMPSMVRIPPRQTEPSSPNPPRLKSKSRCDPAEGVDGGGTELPEPVTLPYASGIEFAQPGFGVGGGEDRSL